MVVGHSSPGKMQSKFSRSKGRGGMIKLKERKGRGLHQSLESFMWVTEARLLAGL